MAMPRNALLIRLHCAGAAAVMFLTTACGGDGTGPADSVTGTYVATVFSVTPTGQAPINVLAAGGSLGITIAANNSTSGTLSIPASVTGTTAFTADMAGTALVTSSTVQFQQAADSFVRDLTWSRTGTSLTVVAQTAGSASHTITLTRQ
jgi:hypothetical protein